MKNEYYSKFESYKKELTTNQNNITKDLDSYKAAIGNKNTNDIESRIKNNLKSFNELIEKLNEAYKDKSAPNMPQITLDKRRKEIKTFIK